MQAACKVIQVLLPLPLKIGELLQAKLTAQSQPFQVREKQSSREKKGPSEMPCQCFVSDVLFILFVCLF